jgi:elongation factor P--(R)-beta-lysine ligase
MKLTRSFFDRRGFLEVTTPCLVPAGAFESSIDPLRIEGLLPPRELHTSPEMEMKVCLAEVQSPIFQIAPCFRNDPLSPIHRKEFTLLEFYRVNASASDVLTDTCDLFEQLAGAPLRWKTVSVPSLFLELGVDLTAIGNSIQELGKMLTEKHLIEQTPTDTWSDLFFRTWIDHIEPNFDPEVPTIVTNYPLEVSPLSRKPSAGFFSDRFEIYWQGMELCNGCSENTRWDDLESRWRHENNLRQARAMEPHPFPSRLREAIHSGLPECAGVAVGMDRLFLAVQKLLGEPSNTLL